MPKFTLQLTESQCALIEEKFKPLVNNTYYRKEQKDIAAILEALKNA